jgi:hypothetical protein
MDLPQFRLCTAPAPDWTVALVSLWHQGKNDWTRAHDTLQDAVGADADWVHAHLHRVEGDVANAAYWYRRARQPIPSAQLSFAAEWDQIASALLRNTQN